MNVIVCNKKKEMLNNLSIDIIKKVEGEFDVDEIINMFRNFYYQRLILDITSIKNYSDIRNLQKLSISLDVEKLILLLDDSDTSIGQDYLSKLISMGIYNFTRNVEGILYLINNPNSYRDVAQYHQIDNPTVTETPQPIYQQSTESSFCRVIGVKSLTKETGSTTFTYLMVKNLKQNYDVVGLEIDSNDFIFFNDRNLLSINNREFSRIVEQNNKKDAIIVDLNNNPTVTGMVQEIIYLVEPSILKLNKMLNEKRNVFSELAGKKIVLNQSLLTNREVSELEYETRTKFFYNMPPLNERSEDNPMMSDFLNKLGFNKMRANSNKKRGLF